MAADGVDGRDLAGTRPTRDRVRSDAEAARRFRGREQLVPVGELTRALATSLGTRPTGCALGLAVALAFDDEVEVDIDMDAGSDIDVDRSLANRRATPSSRRWWDATVCPTP